MSPTLRHHYNLPHVTVYLHLRLLDYHGNVNVLQNLILSLVCQSNRETPKVLEFIIVPIIKRLRPRIYGYVPITIMSNKTWKLVSVDTPSLTIKII